MKFPKHRANLFLVERWTYDNDATIIVGGFSDWEAADNYKDACEQEWNEKTDAQAVFKVVMTTYYEA